MMYGEEVDRQSIANNGVLDQSQLFSELNK